MELNKTELIMIESAIKAKIEKITDELENEKELLEMEISDYNNLLDKIKKMENELT